MSASQVSVDVIVSDPAVRESTRILLDIHDFPGGEFASGKEYILGSVHQSNCLVTDRVLSDMTGLDLLDHLRTGGDTTPAVMMTGKIDPDMTTRAQRLSLKLLEKPPLTDSLLGSIREVCAKQRAKEPATTPPRFPAAMEAEAQFPSWIDNAGTGVATFDGEHRRINEMVIDFYDAILAGEPKPALDELFGRLAEHAAQHFAHEENYMRFSNYPETERHIGCHAALTQELLNMPMLDVRDEENRSARALEVLRYLKNWLMTHILNEDRKLGIWLNSRGIR